LWGRFGQAQVAGAIDGGLEKAPSRDRGRSRLRRHGGNRGQDVGFEVAAVAHPGGDAVRGEVKPLRLGRIGGAGTERGEAALFHAGGRFTRLRANNTL
jgi:hypothetical protein